MPGRRPGRTVSLEFSAEQDDGSEIVFVVEAKIEPFVPAVLNPVDLAHPDEGGGIEDITLKRKDTGEEVDLEVAVEKYNLDRENLEERIHEVAGEADDGEEEEDDYDDEDDELFFDDEG